MQRLAREEAALKAKREALGDRARFTDA